ncbi:hypothetical protein V6B14_00860 [Sporosarcina psychrophila]|uniref:hypothetical protein n=1 Tax=Sporosarcina psychrophila TaxID=1476 RepID=UPI0030CD1587
MKSKLLLLILVFTGLFLILISQHKVGASSQIIREDEAGSYQYTVIKEHEKFTWKIGYKGDVSVINESEQNQEDLHRFMNIVGDISAQKLRLILSVCYFLLIVITVVIAQKKKKMPKEALLLLIIGALGGIAFYVAFQTTLELNHSLNDAKYYYLVLIQK